MAGLGDVHSDGIRFQAALHPKPPALSPGRECMERVHARIHSVCDEAIEAGADPGSMPAQFLPPHRHAGGRCPCCRVELEQLSACGRTAYRCPRCRPTGN